MLNKKIAIKYGKISVVACMVGGIITTTLYAQEAKFSSEAEKKVYVEPISTIKPVIRVKTVVKPVTKIKKIVKQNTKVIYKTQYKTKTIIKQKKPTALQQVISILKKSISIAKKSKNKNFDFQSYKETIEGMVHSLKEVQ